MQTLALLALIALQEPQPTPCPFDRTIELEITAGDPLLEGHGPSRRIAYPIEFSGELYAWTEAAPEVDVFLRLEGKDDRLLGESDDSGGGNAAFAQGTVSAGLPLTVVVALSKPGAGGRCTLHLRAQLDSEATLAAAREAGAALEAIRALHAAGEVETAVCELAELFERLASCEGAAHSRAIHARLFELGRAAIKLSRPELAARIWSRAVQESERTLPRDYPPLQNPRRTLATLLRIVDQPVAALELGERAVASLARTLPEDDIELQKARMELAHSLHDLGDRKRARDLFAQATDALQRTRPDDDLELLEAQNGYANVLRELGDCRTACELGERALATLESAWPGELASIQSARTNLANALEDAGQSERARELEQQVLDLYLLTHAEDDAEVQTARENLAGTLSSMNDLPGARRLQEQVLAVRLRTLGEEDARVHRSRINLAGTLAALGDLDLAYELERAGLDGLARVLPDDDPDVLQAQVNHAATLTELGQLQAARELLERTTQAMARYGMQGIDSGSAYTNLASVLKHLGEMRQALAIEERVVAARKRELSEHHPALLRSELNLAVTLIYLGELERARELLELCRRGFARASPPDHVDQHLVRECLAWTLLLQGAEREACAVAFELSQGLRESTARAASTFAPREMESRVVARSSHVSSAVSLALAARDPSERARLLGEAMAMVETLRGVGLLSARALRAAHELPAVRSLRDEAARANGELMRLWSSGSAGNELSAAMSARDRAQNAALEALARSATAPGLAAVPHPRALGERLQPGEAAVGYWRYVHTRWSDERPAKEEATESLLAFVVRAGGAFECVELGPIAPIEAAIHAWRSCVLTRTVAGAADDAAEARTREAGDTVRRLVLDPLRPALGDGRRVIVALDDVLHLVPLDALPLGAGAVGDELEIELRSTLWELLAPEPPLEGPASLLVLGGIDYDSQADGLGEIVEASAPPTPVAADLLFVPEAPSITVRSGGWANGFPPLPRTQIEAQSVAACFATGFPAAAGATVLTARQASKAALIRTSPSARYVHIASHGYCAAEAIASSVDADSPGAGSLALPAHRARGLSPMVLCGLALAGANRAPDEHERIAGVITAEELSLLDLSRCELAVLSACDTNVGLRRAGQGVASLQKALHMAGARSAITSLWRVDDQATAELMLDFYRRLWLERKSKARALWEAKCELRRKRYGVAEWGAWVLTGDPR